MVMDPSSCCLCAELTSYYLTWSRSHVTNNNNWLLFCDGRIGTAMRISWVFSFYVRCLLFFFFISLPSLVIILISQFAPLAVFVQRILRSSRFYIAKCHVNLRDSLALSNLLTEYFQFYCFSFEYIFFPRALNMCFIRHCLIIMWFCT